MSDTKTYTPDGVDIAVGLFTLPFVFAANTGTMLLLWGWFFVPLGAIALTFGQMLGVWVTVRMVLFFGKSAVGYKSEKDYYTTTIVEPFVRCAMVLLLAILVRGIFL